MVSDAEMDKKFDIVSIGIIAYDTILRTVDESVFSRDTTVLSSVKSSVGGNAMIQSLTAATLGARAAIAGKVSDDILGRACLETLDKAGVDRTYLRLSEKDEMLQSFALVRPDGSRHFLGYPGTNNRTLSLEDLDLTVLEESKIVSYGNFFWLNELDKGGCTELFRRAQKAGALTAADCSDDSFGEGAETVLKNLPYIDFFIPSRVEAEYVSGEKDPEKMADRLFARGCRNLVIKMGEKGCYVNTGKEDRMIPAFSVDHCVDTTGAGDSFVGGFLTGIAEGMNIFDAAELGCAAGAVSVTAEGGFAALKSREQADCLIRARKGF